MSEQLWTNEQIQRNLQGFLVGGPTSLDLDYDEVLGYMMIMRDEYEQRIADLEWYAGDLERQVKELRSKLVAMQAGEWTPLPYGKHDLGSGEIEVLGDMIAIFGADDLGEDSYSALAHDSTYAFCRRVLAAQPQPDPLAYGQATPWAQIKQLCDILVETGDLDSIAPRIIVEDWLQAHAAERPQTQEANNANP